MGREVLRVPKDFDWPIDVIWPGRFISICGAMEELAELIKERNKKEVSSCDLCYQWQKLSGMNPKEKGECPHFSWKDPPTGPYYQLWSTTTEGHPMTPAFATPEELAQYCADNKVSSFGRDTASYDEWFRFIKVGWALSGVAMPGKGIMSGVAAASHCGATEK